MDKPPQIITKKEIVIDGVTILINRMTGTEFSLQLYKTGEPNKIKIFDTLKRLPNFKSEVADDTNPDVFKFGKINFDSNRTIDDVEGFLNQNLK